MRNKTAFIFVLLANMILLVYTGIPHHHHTEAPIGIAIECSHHQEHAYHENMPVCHDDHEQGEIVPCITTAMLIPNNQYRTSASLMQITTSDFVLFSLLVFNYYTISDRTENSVEVIETIPLYSRLLISSQGLRAPPVC